MKEGQSKRYEIFVKVTFKGSTFNFGKDIKSYQQLENSAKIRFSQLKNLAFFFNQQLVTEYNFNTLVKLQSFQGQKSIKLELKESNQQKKVQKSPTRSKKYSFNPNESSKQTKKYSFNAEEFDDQQQKIENEQLQDEFHTLSLGQKQSNQSKLINPTKINIKVLISKEFQCIQANLGDQYFWKCSLVNLSEFDIEDKLFIKDFNTLDMIEVKDFKRFQNRLFIFGPYSKKQLGKYSHFYQICFKYNGKKSFSIGNKFGFICEAKKKIIVKEIQNKVVQRVNKVKSFCVCQKTTQYIVKALKQLNITDDSIDGFQDQDLIDLIESLNTQ